MVGFEGEGEFRCHSEVFVDQTRMAGLEQTVFEKSCGRESHAPGLVQIAWIDKSVARRAVGKLPGLLTAVGAVLGRAPVRHLRRPSRGRNIESGIKHLVELRENVTTLNGYGKLIDCSLSGSRKIYAIR